MKRYLTAACGLGAIIAMSGCVVADGPYRGGVYPQGTIQYDGYYDGYYGTYTSGYWGSDGYFYYQGSDRKYRRDDARHFLREKFNGAQGVRGDERARQAHENRHDNQQQNQNNYRNKNQNQNNRRDKQDRHDGYDNEDWRKDRDDRRNWE